MKTLVLLITLIFICAFGNVRSQNIEEFLVPYADKIVKNTSFEFTDKVTKEKFVFPTDIVEKLKTDKSTWENFQKMFYK